jgi:hypothetical protein
MTNIQQQDDAREHPIDMIYLTDYKPLSAEEMILLKSQKTKAEAKEKPQQDVEVESITDGSPAKYSSSNQKRSKQYANVDMTEVAPKITVNSQYAVDNNAETSGLLGGGKSLFNSVCR